MNRKAYSAMMLKLLSISMLTLAFNNKFVLAYPTQPYITVPHHYQSHSQFCGPASLEMVFDFYGPDVSQWEIADAARTWYTWGTAPEDDMRRAAHFSNLSFSVGPWMPEAFKGYSSRTLGYAAFSKYGMTLDQLRCLIDNGYPLTVNTWYILNPPRYGHYRVVVGYTETHIIFHDPWYGMPYKGPNMSVTNSEFLAMWEHEDNWGLFVSPWKVTMSAPYNVQQYSTFTVAATITYPCPDPFLPEENLASLCNATLILPEELCIASGDTAKKTLGTGNLFPRDSATISWVVQANAHGNFTLTVEVEGKVTGHVGRLGSYPEYDYEDRIGGVSNHSVSVHSISAEDLIKTLIETTETWDLGYGIQTSLTSKLQAAYRLLDVGSQNAPKRQLAAFINEVEAQSGKHITPDAADILIESAEYIISHL